MTLEEFKAKLKELNIPESGYSFDGSLDPDRIVLYDSYGIWNVFYFDEKGNKDLLGMFGSQEDALDFLYKDALREANIYGTKNK